MTHNYNIESDYRFFGGALLPFAGGLLIGGLLPYPGRPTYNNNYQQVPTYYQPVPYYVAPAVPYYITNRPYPYQTTYQTTNNMYYKSVPTMNNNPYYSTYTK
ncbi:MAG: hypothetical protein J1F31_06375 [Erysipelotrichales bacterium]|nr:hypothetical protein [Erysipelotrichales bacterium]